MDEPVYVILLFPGQVVVDHYGNALDIYTPSKKIGCDQYPARPRTVLSDDDVTLRLIHIAML